MNRYKLLEEETLNIFNYNSLSDLISDSLDNPKMAGYLILADILSQNKDVLHSINYFSSVLSGRDNSNLKNLINYLRELDENEDKTMTFVKNLSQLMSQETPNINHRDVYKFLEFKTKEDYEKRYSIELRNIAEKLLSDIRLSYSLKLFSQYTTDIEHNKINDFLDYLNLTFKKEELEEFNKILEKESTS